MEKERMNVENINEAISVLIQVAHLAQSRGILSFEDAVKTKSAIDFFQQPPVAQPMPEVNSKEPVEEQPEEK